MKVLILYRPDSDHASEVEAFVRDYQRMHDSGSKVELLSLSTRDGAAMASLYDVMAYPSVMVLAEDGRLLNLWQGRPLPLMNDVASYAYAG